jgi:hypothetical protein
MIVLWFVLRLFSALFALTGYVVAGFLWAFGIHFGAFALFAFASLLAWFAILPLFKGDASA